MAKVAFNATARGNTLGLNPDECILVGFDTTDGPEHPLYSPTVHEEVHEELVDSLEDLDQLQPIGVCNYNNDDRPFVRFGRKRVKAMRALNKRLVAKGEEPRLIYAVNAPRGTQESDHTLAILAENNLRFQDSSLTKATIAAHFLKNRNDTQHRRRVAIALGMRLQDLDNLLRLVESPELKEAVENKEMSVNAAVHLTALPRDEMKKIVEMSRQTGKRITTDEARETATKARRTKKTVAKGGTTDDIVVRPSMSSLKKILRAAAPMHDEKIPPDAFRMLQFVLGETSPRNVKGLSALITKIEKDAAKKDG
jgi:hypothetical protein